MKQLELALNSSLTSIEYEPEGASWYFGFDGEVSLSVQGLWRMFKAGELVAVSNDHGHQFGLPAPLDLVQAMKDLLRHERLTGIQVDSKGDVSFQFSQDMALVAYVYSMGYETYHFSAAGKNYIGMGGGELSYY